MVRGKSGERGIDLVVGRKYERENRGHFREIYRRGGEGGVGIPYKQLREVRRREGVFSFRRSIVVTSVGKRSSGMAIYGFLIYLHLSYFSCPILYDFNFACWLALIW